MFPFLDALPDDIRPPIETAAGGVIALLLTLVPYLIVRKIRAKKTDDTADDARTEETAERLRLVAPLFVWLGLTVGISFAFLFIYPRKSWEEVFTTDDANLLTLHAFFYAALATLLALVPGNYLPRVVAYIWRALLFAGVGVLGVWLMGSFLITNEIWTPTKFWTVAGASGLTTGLVAATLASSLERTTTPALTTLSTSGLLAMSAAPVFFSKSTTMAHTLAGTAIALALLALATIKWKDLGRSCVVPLIAVGVLVPALVIPAVYAEEMLVATLIPLALAPLALVAHRLPIVERLPGPAWLLPGLLQLVALIAVVAASTAFATGVLEVIPENAPWHEGAPADDGGSDDPYSDYDFYSQ